MDLINIKYENIQSFDFDNYKTKAKVLRVYDGDSIEIAFYYNNIIYKLKCRLTMIDSPEIRNSSDIGKQSALIVRNKLIQLITNINIELSNCLSYVHINKLLFENTKIIDVLLGKFDKYGRTLITIYVDGNNINDVLLDKKYAKKYEGGTKQLFTTNDYLYITKSSQ
jgi:endonuclease YncB( thermonuclease family)